MSEPFGSVTVKVGIEIKKQDAEMFLRLVEMYVNQEKVGIAWRRLRGGSVRLEFVDEVSVRREAEDDKD